MTLKFRLSCMLVAIIAALGGQKEARSATAQSWEHKDWRSSSEGHRRSWQCDASTGGDGGPSLRVSAAAPGEFAVVFSEPTARGIRPAMKPDDQIQFRTDDKRASAFEATVISVGVDKDGIPFAHASLPGGNAPDMIAAMRNASFVSVMSRGKRSSQWAMVHRFSLAGFTANFLKLSEWCGFDASRAKKS